MLRVASLTLVVVLAILAGWSSLAAAEPQPGDDLAICRDRQADAQARAQACDKLLNADRLTGKDNAIALSVRGNTLRPRHRDLVHGRRPRSRQRRHAQFARPRL
jgi:hypothetical protein